MFRGQVPQNPGWSYDPAGNLLTDGLGNSYQYDAESKIKSSAGATYYYTAEGQRVEKAVGSTKVDTVYFGGRPIARLSGSAWTDLVYVGGGLLAEVPGTQTASPTYRVTDHLGSVVETLSATGAVLSTQDLGPFGEIFTGGISDAFVFTGKERDAESGNDYFGARFYSSDIGRFMTPDWASRAEAVPYSDISDPQSLNLYAYVRNNPMSRTDAEGHHVEQANSNGWWDPNPYLQFVRDSMNGGRRQIGGAALLQNPLAQQQNNPVATAEGYLSKSKAMRPVLKAFKSGHFHLSLINDGNDRYDPATRTVYWDPNSALETTDGGHQTPALGFGHEMAHATGNRHMTAELSGTADPQYDTREERRVILNYEDPAARQLGESTRHDHGGNPYNVASPTSIIPLPQ
jgi:RHS repeat-associated protein